MPVLRSHVIISIWSSMEKMFSGVLPRPARPLAQPSPSGTKNAARHRRLRRHRCSPQDAQRPTPCRRLTGYAAVHLAAGTRRAWQVLISAGSPPSSAGQPGIAGRATPGMGRGVGFSWSRKRHRPVGSRAPGLPAWASSCLQRPRRAGAAAAARHNLPHPRPLRLAGLPLCFITRSGASSTEKVHLSNREQPCPAH